MPDSVPLNRRPFPAHTVHVLRTFPPAEGGDGNLSADPRSKYPHRSPSPQVCWLQAQSISRERMISPESARKTCSDHETGRLALYSNDLHQQSTKSGAAGSRSSWSAGSPSASKQSAFGSVQRSPVAGHREVHTAQNPRLYSTPTSPGVYSRKLDACQNAGVKSERCNTLLQGPVHDSIDVASELFKHELNRAITNLHADISHKLYVLDWTLHKLATSQSSVESRLSALEADTKPGAEAVAKDEKRLTGIEERLAELDEVVERNETVAKMKADIEHRLCDLEMQIISLPELKRGQFKDTNNTLPVKSTSVAGTFSNSNPHSPDQHKSDENLTATFDHRLNALETHVDLIRAILTKMEDRTSIKHSEKLSDNADVDATFKNIRKLLEQAEVGTDAKPHSCLRSRQFQETGSTCFPIAEDE